MSKITRPNIQSKKEPYSQWWNKMVTLYRGEEILDTGTIKELAEKRNTRKYTIYWYTMPTCYRRVAKSKNPDKRIIGVLL